MTQEAPEAAIKESWDSYKQALHSSAAAAKLSQRSLVETWKQSGLTLRQIAAIVGVSHQRVDELMKRAEKDVWVWPEDWGKR